MKQKPAVVIRGWLVVASYASILAHLSRHTVRRQSYKHERLLSLVLDVERLLLLRTIAQRMYRVPDASPPSTDAPMSDKQAYMIEHLNKLPWHKVSCIANRGLLNKPIAANNLLLQ